MSSCSPAYATNQRPLSEATAYEEAFPAGRLPLWCGHSCPGFARPFNSFKWILGVDLLLTIQMYTIWGFRLTCDVDTVCFLLDIQDLDYTLIGLHISRLKSIPGGMPEGISLQQENELQVKLATDDMLTVVHHPNNPKNPEAFWRSTSGYPLHFIEGESGWWVHIAVAWNGEHIWGENSSLPCIYTIYDGWDTV